jgi:hypothetical protein
VSTSITYARVKSRLSASTPTGTSRYTVLKLLREINRSEPSSLYLHANDVCVEVDVDLVLQLQREVGGGSGLERTSIVTVEVPHRGYVVLIPNPDVPLGQLGGAR